MAAPDFDGFDRLTDAEVDARFADLLAAQVMDDPETWLGKPSPGARELGSYERAEVTLEQARGEALLAAQYGPPTGRTSSGRPYWAIDLPRRFGFFDRLLATFRRTR